jgi:coenzyme F420 hydrogenase subunit beta
MASDLDVFVRPDQVVEICRAGRAAVRRVGEPGESRHQPPDRLDRPPDLGVCQASFAARVRPESKLISNAQDGGVVTAMLLASLAAGEIDGAVVAREDPDHPWKGVPHLATTPGAIAEAVGSFYNQTMALACLDLASAGLPPDARIAVVGTTCETQGIRALQARRWRRDSSRADAVTLTIALLCTKSSTIASSCSASCGIPAASIWPEVGKVDVIHGRMVVADRGGVTMIDEPVKDFHGAALGLRRVRRLPRPSRRRVRRQCRQRGGYSSVMVRTEPAPVLSAAWVRARHRPDAAPQALGRLDRLDKKVAARTLQRPLDPDGPLFVDFEEHVAFYAGTDRAPVWRLWRPPQPAPTRRAPPLAPVGPSAAPVAPSTPSAAPVAPSAAPSRRARRAPPPSRRAPSRSLQSTSPRS